MRVLVCGGRNYSDWLTVYSALDKLYVEEDVSCVIHGAAPGADSLAAKWAEIHKIPQLSCPADWDAHGKAAGPIRNQLMLQDGKPDVVLAFPGGRGTADMVGKAKVAKVRVIEVLAPEPGAAR